MFREPKEDFLLAGDWHGSFSQADKVIRHAKEIGTDTIFQVGDFGIWDSSTKKFLNQMQHLLEQWDIQLYFIDGNHENFPMLYEKAYNDDGTRFVRENITYIPRGYRWEWHGLTYVALGGAASIDKRFRIEGRSWWPEEYLTEEDILTAQSGGPADIMITHDSPFGAPNSVCDDIMGQLGAVKYFGQDALHYTTLHRKLLQRVTDVVAPRVLIHGHYHTAMRGTYFHGDDKFTAGDVIGLDQGLASLPKHTLLFNPEQAKERIAELDTLEY